ncbi:alpha/beta fold hydrolase [Legionella maioricensis]|uniref:Alpha/beta fold hydrolase n=1 Tax=Legionella maioricensis TaxID=2896528 RepID=A0A9X2D154_9GAMM|nr:alpha/beta fold hydrolase [Legionella maioricensis]MCL9684273.1 alpha/beta fold hydrolase [Legionella maioricensis]MCL9687139.1 alpha/beta fold hydrolase [Legionella maioricensis]
MGVVDNKNIQTLTELIELRAIDSSDKTAFTFIEPQTDSIQTLTYKELRDKAIAVAAELQKQKITPGDRVLLVYPPGLDLIIAMFGCMFAGGICILTYPPATDKMVQKIQHIITDAKPDWALCTRNFANQFRQLKRAKSAFKIPLMKHLGKRILKRAYTLSHWDVEHLKWITTDQLRSKNTYKPEKIESKQNVLFQYSSGSTSKPKGIVLTHQNLVHNIETIYKEMCGNRSDHICCFWLPPYHDMGLICGIFTPIFGGMPSILLSPIDFLKRPLTWLEIITKYRVTITGGPNFSYDYCVNKITEDQKNSLNLSSLQMAFCGAEPIHTATFDRFYNYFVGCGFKRESFGPCYGLAESSVFVCGAGINHDYSIGSFSNTLLKQGKVKEVSATEQDSKSLVSVGLPVFNVKIVDPDARQVLAADKIGEIWVGWNESTAQGYWHQPELTHDVFQAKLVDDDADAYYLRTGDLGFIYNNQLFICGRIKDVIIIHGVNFYPQDIEVTVSGAHPSIRYGCVAAFNIEVDEEEKLAIVCEVNEGTDYDAVIHAINLAIAKEHQIPVHTIALIKAKSLPKTTSGKIQRSLSRELLLKRELSLVKLWDVTQLLTPKTDISVNGAAPLPINLKDFLINKVAAQTQLKPEAIDGDRPLTEYGIDSIGIVALVDEMEQLLGKKIEIGLFWDYPTINMITEYFSKEPGALVTAKAINPYAHGVGNKGIFKKAGKTGILLIHGFSGTPGEMLDFGNYLWKANITVAIPQLSGHCASEKDFKCSNRHDWYLSVLNAYNLLLEHCDQIYVSGLSVGGLLGLRLAAEQQKKLAGVILLSPLFFYDGWNMSKLKANLLMPMVIHTPLRFLASFKEKSPYGIKDEQARQAIEVVMQSQSGDFSEQVGIMKISGVSLKEVNRLIRDTTRLLPKVHCPALIIHSLEDDMASTRNADFVQRKIGSREIELCFLEDCYHVITLDKKKKEVAERVLLFLKSNN